MSLGRPEQAISAYRSVMASAPHDGSIDLGIAIAYGENGQPEAAEAAARTAISKSFDRPGTRYVLGRALFDQDKFEEAEAQFRQVLALDPRHSAAHGSLAELVWMRTGDLDAAVAMINSTGGGDANVELRMIKARLLHEAGASERACAELASSLETHVQHVELHMLAAQCALALEPVRALWFIERALQLNPRNRPAHGLRGVALLAVGRADEAADLASRLLDYDACDVHALALRAAAWRVLGDKRFTTLCDYPHLVRSYRIDVPSGWGNLDDYLHDLSISLHARHNQLRAHPPAQSARGGTQVQLRPDAVASDHPFRAFRMAADGPIRRYMKEVMATGVDAFSRRHTGRYRFNGIWSVRLQAQGHHANHFHGKGWISSAFHIVVPASASDGDRSGWLKFGEPSLPIQPVFSAEHHVKPEPGLLTLFPSWMWHGTVPFQGKAGEHRLSIAFDVVPA
ncbi:hypothetical protein B0E50_11855 [Rhodanobacter sp. C01]|nr:hypothetical protein B0E50_11855 [Rhodanobacter sp. C01]